MLQDYFFEGFCTWFGLVNFGLTLVCTALLLFLCVRRRYLCFKPGMLLLFFSNLFMQWPLALYAPYYDAWLPRAIDMSLLVHGFMFCGILIESVTYLRPAAVAFAALASEKTTAVTSRFMTWMLTAAFVGLALTSIYLWYVPLKCTGLTAVLTEPKSASIIRELSLKLLAPLAPKYAYSLLSSCVLYVLFSLCLLAVLHGLREHRLGLTSLAVTLAILAVAAAALTGVKGNLVKLALIAGALVFWRERASFKPRPLTFYAVIGIVALTPALMFNLLFAVSGRNLSGDLPRQCLKRLDTVPLATEIVYSKTETMAGPMPLNNETLAAQVGAVLYRAFVVPLEVGGWYVHYAQTRGPIGIAGVPKLAWLMGVTPVDAPNLIGKTYGPIYYGHPVLGSISAGSGFLFSYYAYFGLWVLPMALALLLLLDAVVYLYCVLPPALCLVLASALTVQTMLFLQADLTTVLFSHGIIPTVLFVAGLAALPHPHDALARPKTADRGGRVGAWFRS